MARSVDIENASRRVNLRPLADDPDIVRSREWRDRVLKSNTPMLDARLEWLKSLSEPDREAICTNCGLCCFSGVTVNETPVIMRALPCRFLAIDQGISKCTVYEDRFAKAAWCQPIDQAIRHHLVPNECPYVVGIENFGGKAIIHDERTYVSVERLVRKSFQDDPPPEADWACVSTEDREAFMAGT